MATRDLHEKVGTMEYEKLFAGIEPPALVRGGVIAKGSSDVTLKRGTLLGKKDGKLSIYGGEPGVSPDCILTDDVTVGTSVDENVTVYISGNFNIDAVIVADEYTITEADKDTLRTKGILFGTVQDA
ncbi:MAG: head decoration protein [Aristaeellaceae bacterium]